MADVDPAQYDADVEADDSVLLEDLLPCAGLGPEEVKINTTDGVDLALKGGDADLDLDEEGPSTSAGNYNDDTPEKEKRHNEVTEREAVVAPVSFLTTSTPTFATNTVTVSKAVGPPPLGKRPSPNAATATTPAGPPQAQINPLPPLPLAPSRDIRPPSREKVPK